MKKLVKIVLALVVVLVVVLVLAAVGVFFYLNTIAKSAVERGGTYATGTPTTVDAVSVGLFSGEIGLNGFDIANPAGFSRPSFFSVADADAAIALPSLREDTIVVPYIRLDDIGLTLLRGEDGRFNYQVILDHLANLAKAGGDGQAPPPDAEEQGGATRYIVQEITLTDLHVVAEALGREVEATIPEIRLTDVGSDTSNGVLLSQLQGVILKAVMEAVVKSNIDLPGELKAALAGGLAKVPDITDLGVEQIGDITRQLGEGLDGVPGGDRARQAVEDAGRRLQGATGDAGQDAERALRDATGNLGNLLGGNRDADAEPDAE
jgi:hypothetical protein